MLTERLFAFQSCRLLIFTHPCTISSEERRLLNVRTVWLLIPFLLVKQLERSQIAPAADADGGHSAQRRAEKRLMKMNNQSP